MHRISIFPWWHPVLVGAALLALPSQGGSGRSHSQDEIRYECRVIADAEDGSTAGWDTWDGNPAVMWRVAVDPDNRKNHAIQLTGGFETCHRFTFPAPQEDTTVIQWRMRPDEARYYVYVVCKTSEGILNLRYSPGDPGQNGGLVGNDPVLHLGKDVAAEEWWTVRRDVLADLRVQYPRIAVLDIRAAMFRGSGYIDDIRVYSYPDADHDLLPDDFERRRKLDKNDPTDATASLLEEVIELTDSVDGRGQVGDRGREPATNGEEKETAATGQKRVSFTAAERAELEQFYAKRLAEHLASLPPPQPGKTYRLQTREGEKIVGELTQFADGRIYLRTAHGNIVVPLNRVNWGGDSAAFFPQETARQLARRDTQQRMNELAEAKSALAATQIIFPTEAAAVDAPTEPAPAVDAPAEPTPAMPAETGLALDLRETDEPLVYAPEPAPTPASLKPALIAFAEWLKVQHHRTGGKIADRLFAKDQSGNAVLYLVMDADFLNQDYDVRQRTAVGIQQFWSFRCQALGLVDLPKAHVVLIDDQGKVVGGSRPADASDVWVKGR